MEPGDRRRETTGAREESCENREEEEHGKAEYEEKREGQRIEEEIKGLTSTAPRVLVTSVAPEDTDEAVTVLCDAFRDYPVMRYVLGSADDYGRRLRMLIGFFVSARVFREEPVLGIHDQDGTLAAVSLVTLPGERPVPQALSIRRESVWKELGPAERERYEAFGTACAQFGVESPHHHLNMIGVRRSHVGRGLGRKLLEVIHQMSDADDSSAGVSLSTESAHNLRLYEHFGYRQLGHAVVGPGLETWAFFRSTPGLTTS
jgi:GNAT superfamily N-acetyltransferase